MRKLFVCRILSEIKPVEYKHIKICKCPIFMCSQNNMKLQQSSDDIPYIKCKVDKQKDPQKYILSHSCNCVSKCKIKSNLYLH